jgi:hypothetical protein
MRLTPSRFIEWLDDPKHLFNGVFIEVIENCIDIFTIKATLDHLLLSPRIRNLFDTDGDLHGTDVTGQLLWAPCEFPNGRISEWAKFWIGQGLNQRSREYKVNQ